MIITMKRTILSIAGAMVLSLSAVHAQEADRFVGAQHVRFQTACHPEDVKHYDTKLLRERFVMEKVMEADSILLMLTIPSRRSISFITARSAS